MENNSEWFRDKINRINGKDETKEEELRRRYCQLYGDVYFKDIDKRIKDYEKLNWNQKNIYGR
tara:strand:+ start:974 stop:1162 length:189 start_codon:yes stop_codon:yes gene_type:complete